MPSAATRGSPSGCAPPRRDCLPLESVATRRWDDLVDGALLHPIDLDESGLAHQASPSCAVSVAVWSNTGIDGRESSFRDSCNGWNDLGANGSLGDVHDAGNAWTDYVCSAACTVRAALYCIAQ